jgi:hypothetical protein
MARALVFAALVTVALVSPAAAQIYKWVDEQGNAHFAEGLMSVPEQYRESASPMGLRNSPVSSSSTGSGSKGTAAAATIRYIPGQQILVDVKLNGRGSARLVLDTGADRTLITPRALVAAGTTLKRTVGRSEIRGVAGTDEAIYVVLDSLEVEGVRIENLPVVAYEIGLRESDGLLGRDFLDHFTINIDSARGVVTLAPK